MKMSGYASVALACLLVCLKSVYGGGSNSPSFITLTDNPEITCNGYASCSNDTCNFNSTLKSNDSSRYVPGTENVVHCGVITLDVKFPTSKDKLGIGTFTPFCYNYTNINNTGFDALQVVIQKANSTDLNTTSATVTATGATNYTATVNEVNDTVTIVVLPSSGCTVYVPPTTETTSVGPATTTAASGTTSTTGSSNTTGGPTTAAPSSATKMESTILLAVIATRLFFLQV